MGKLFALRGCKAESSKDCNLLFIYSAELWCGLFSSMDSYGTSRCCSSQYRICVWQTSHALLTISWGKSWAFVLLHHDDQPEQRFTFLRGRNELFMLIKALISREWKSNPYFDYFLYWNIFQCLMKYREEWQLLRLFISTRVSTWAISVVFPLFSLCPTIKMSDVVFEFLVFYVSSV